MWSSAPRFPLSEDYFPAVSLSEREQTEYVQRCRATIPKFFDLLRRDAVWKQLRVANGIQVDCCTDPAFTSDGGLKMFRSKTRPPAVELDISSPVLVRTLMMDTTAKLRKTYPSFDPMFLDGQVLATCLSDTLPDGNRRLCTLDWAAFGTPPVVWDRDFVFLKYLESSYVDPVDGKRCAIVVTMSVDRLECPPLPPRFKCTRGVVVLAGYMVKQVTPTQVEFAMVLQIDPRGWLPTWAVNLAAADQATNIVRVREWATRVEADRRQQAAITAAATPRPAVASPTAKHHGGGDGDGDGDGDDDDDDDDVSPALPERVMCTSVAAMSHRLSKGRACVMPASSPVFGRLLLPAANGARASYTSATVALPSSRPLLLAIAPQQLQALAATLAELRSGVPPTATHGRVVCQALLCDPDQLLAACSADAASLQLLLFRPLSASHVFRATWENVWQFASRMYPGVDKAFMAAGLRPKLWPFKPGMPLSGARMSPRALIALRHPSVYHVRQFLATSLGLGKYYAGDGWVYDERGAPAAPEWCMQNVELPAGKDVAVASLPAGLVRSAVLALSVPSSPAPRPLPVVARCVTPADRTTAPSNAAPQRAARSADGHASQPRRSVVFADDGGDGVVPGASRAPLPTPSRRLHPLVVAAAGVFSVSCAAALLLRRSASSGRGAVGRLLGSKA